MIQLILLKSRGCESHNVGQLAERFGRAGRKGEVGERFAMARWKEAGFEVIDRTQEISFQKAGIDFEIKKGKKSCSVDNKNNLRYRKGKIILSIEIMKGKKRPGWFHTSQAKLISHTHTSRKILLYYDLKKLREKLKPLIKSNEIKVENVRKTCKMVYIEKNDNRFKNIIKEL